jgi:N-carbamoyl-L-amino-acid hydrolase
MWSCRCRRSCGITAPRLHSPGTHDAKTPASGVKTAMLLVRNQSSHNPHEAMETDDLMAAIATAAAGYR